MNIIEQIDARFVSGNAVPVSRTHLTADEWQQIKAELAKVREDALEEAAKAIEANKYEDLVKAEIREPLNGLIDILAKQIRIRALKDGE